MTGAEPRRPVPGEDLWRYQIRDTIGRFGHRNWILVADSAYPLQTAPGVTLVATGQPHEVVLEVVFDALATAEHVRANVYLDAELEHIPDDHAPGIEQLRAALTSLAPEAERVPHEERIARVGEAGREFQVLLVKTTCTLPYTTVFCELDCAYWDAGREAALRSAMG